LPSNKTSDQETRLVKTACRACIANCGVIAHVRDGRVVKLEGNPEDPMSKGRLCAKGLAGIQALYNPNRIKYPMKRIGPRGSGQWERISWDEALDIIARKLMETRKNTARRRFSAPPAAAATRKSGASPASATFLARPTGLSPAAPSAICPGSCPTP